ncbi:hypothetical protein BKA66DRAFT_209206 [Pyrenochaeta sp. MPI-SDFR-AT-0127]|nr:hypothetical protein BKA66DRAFT_209206 [Pyrenochaeta sp. MPI-SDFR-AT-0127]
MALPALQHNDAYPGPGSPAGRQRDLLPGADSAKRRADDSRRLRRVKDSKEQLKRRTRARAASNGTIDTLTTTSTSAGRSYTVANVHNGVIYLRYAEFALFLAPHGRGGRCDSGYGFIGSSRRSNTKKSARLSGRGEGVASTCIHRDLLAAKQPHCTPTTPDR